MHEYTSTARVWGLTCPGFPEEVSRARRWTRDILRGSPLAEDAEFMALVSARWKELRKGILADAALLARVDAMAARLAQAAVRDFERWPVASIDSFFELPPDATWEGQLQVLRSWMTARAAWLDTAVDQAIDVADYPLAE